MSFFERSTKDIFALHRWRHPLLIAHAYFYLTRPDVYISGAFKLLNYFRERLSLSTWKKLRPIFAYIPDRYHGKVVTLADAEQIVSLSRDIAIDPELAKRVIPFEIANQIVVKNPDSICVVDCFCRQQSPNPCLPLHVCMIIGEPFASYAVEHGAKWNAHLVSQEEAKEVLRQAHEAGFVHNAFVKDAMGDRLYAICNCCKCCCGGMIVSREFKRIYGDEGRKPPTMVAPSGYVAQVNQDNCVGCGECAKFCQFEAITLSPARRKKDRRAIVDFDKCYGCGICVDKCKKEAITLSREPAKGIPLDMKELLQQSNA